MDEGNTIGVIYFDFTKAFDSAKHSFPMTYMKSFGLGDIAVQWIEWMDRESTHRWGTFGRNSDAQ